MDQGDDESVSKHGEGAGESGVQTEGCGGGEEVSVIWVR